MPPKINLLYVIYSLDNGGAETLAIRLAEKLDKSIFNAAVCSLSDQGPLREVLEKKQVPYFTLGKREGKDLRVAWRLRTLLSRERIDLVHTHNQGPLLYTYLATLLWKKIKIVHTEHINMAKEFSYSQKNLFYNNILYRSLDGFINIAQHLTKDYCSRFDLTRAKVQTIHNSVDPMEHNFEPINSLRQELGVAERVPLIGNISALRPQKDHATLLHAMKKVCEVMPDAVLVLAGDGELKQELLKLRKNLVLEENVKFLGFRSDVDNLLSQFDVFALSSLYEGLPLCILEAMAAGKPIIATDADGTNEVVRHQNTGLLVPLKDPEKFAQAILQVIKDANYAAKLGEKAKKLVEKHHNMGKMIAEYESFYTNLLYS